jgi:hypothetical protein
MVTLRGIMEQPCFDKNPAMVEICVGPNGRSEP